MPVCQLVGVGDLHTFEVLAEATCEDRDFPADPVFFINLDFVESKNACTAEEPDRKRLLENNRACI